MFQPCHFVTPDKRYFNCIDLGPVVVKEEDKLQRLIEIASERYDV